MTDNRKMREAMIDQDGAVWEKIGGAWSLYKPAQSVPVVGEPIYWIDPDDDANLSRIGRVGWSPLYGESPASIPAADLATLREKAAEADELRKALLALKEDCQTSNDCQYGTLSTSHVARIVDAAIAPEGEK